MLVDYVDQVGVKLSNVYETVCCTTFVTSCIFMKVHLPLLLLHIIYIILCIKFTNRTTLINIQLFSP